MTRRSSLSYPKFSARKSMSSGVARWSYNSLYSLSFIEKARRSARSGITKRRVSLKACGLGAAKRRTCGEVQGRLKPRQGGWRADGGPGLPPEARREAGGPPPRPRGGPQRLRGGGDRPREAPEGRQGPRRPLPPRAAGGTVPGPPSVPGDDRAGRLPLGRNPEEGGEGGPRAGRDVRGRPRRRPPDGPRRQQDPDVLGDGV